MKHHYFVTTPYVREAGTCLPAVLERVRKAPAPEAGEHPVDVWKVPGPVRYRYRMERVDFRYGRLVIRYAPQVEGAELIDTFSLKVGIKSSKWEEK